MTGQPTTVYIAEEIWFGDNPVDGRKRLSVHSTLDGALSALNNINGPGLVATEKTGGALGTDDARTWAVHEPDEEPSDEGWMWITAEQVQP